MDPKKKFQLFKQSKHFCSVPWNHIKVNMNGNVATCVYGTKTLGNIEQQSISEILNNPILKEIRETLYKDQPHENCRACQASEHESDGKKYYYLRDLYNSYFVKNDVDYSDSSLFKLSGVDLHWSSTCNLKCVTCWEKQSSSIAQEKKMPVITTTRKSADALTDWIAENQDNLKEIYLSGGEPTLIKHNLRLLKKIKKMETLQLRINSNLAWSIDNDIVQEIMQFPNVLWTVSADDTDARFDYIRHGASWNQFLENLKWLRNSHVKIRVNSVFFVNNAIRITDTQEFFRTQYQITDFTINQCGMDHPELKPCNLPLHIKQLARDKILQYKEKYHNDNNLAGQLENCLKELALEHNGHDFRKYFDNLDRMRGTNWRLVFPEMSND